MLAGKCVMSCVCESFKVGLQLNTHEMWRSRENLHVRKRHPLALCQGLHHDLGLDLGYEMHCCDGLLPHVGSSSLVDDILL